MTPRSSTSLRRYERPAMMSLAAFTVVSVVGYAVYGVHPQNLPSYGFALKFYAISYQFFAQLHILIAFAVLAVLLVTRTGTRWLSSLAAVAILSFTAEHLGTGYGLPFGEYAYTGLLGPRIGERVPALIPASWFLMASVSWVIAHAAFPARRGARWTFGALGLVVWDLALDPAMSALTPYWIWGDTGPYYGMPWSNLVGWFVTGLVLMAALDALSSRARLHDLPPNLAVAYYTIVLALPMGMLAAHGEWLGVGVTLVGAGATLLAGTALRRLIAGADPMHRPIVSVR